MNASHDIQQYISYIMAV